jgi:Peptidase family M48
MGQRLAALVVACVMGLSLPMGAADQSENERTSRKVAALFERHNDETIDAFLMRLRAAPPDEASRAKVVASLPSKGEVRPSRKDREKLSAAERILDYSGRSGVIMLKVIHGDSAFVGLYDRAVVLVTQEALNILEADELAALVAHEMGHDGDWDAYVTAMQEHQIERMRELELKSDGIAVLTLQRLGLSSERLVTAVRKMMRYNDWRDRMAGVTPQAGGTLTNAERYVSLTDRVAFIRAVSQVKWKDWTPSNAMSVR